VHRPAVLMVAKGQRPHPRRTDRRGVDLHDSADDNAPLAPWQVPARRAEGGGSGRLRALELGLAQTARL
jgi:hypothetical protein